MVSRVCAKCSVIVLPHEEMLMKDGAYIHLSCPAPVGTFAPIEEQIVYRTGIKSAATGGPVTRRRR